MGAVDAGPATDEPPTGSPGGLGARVGARRSVVRARAVEASIAVVGLPLVIVAALGIHWWTHPNLFADGGIVTSMGPRPVQKAQWTFAVVMPASGLGQGHGPTPFTITFTGSPDVTLRHNSERASAVVSVCTPYPEPKGTLIGAVDGTGARYCATLMPVRAGVTMPWPTLGAYLVCTLTPRQAGHVHVTGVDFHYRLGRDHWWQRGVDRVSVDVHQRVVG